MQGKYTITKLSKSKEERGWLSEIFRSDKMSQFQQVYVATIKPGYMRGDHYHKQRVEWFSVIKGKGKLTLYGADKRRLTIPLDEKDKTKLAERLGVVVDKKVELKCTVDSNLMGGIIARIGGKLLDGCTLSKLAALKKELIGTGK